MMRDVPSADEVAARIPGAKPDGRGGFRVRGYCHDARRSLSLTFWDGDDGGRIRAHRAAARARDAQEYADGAGAFAALYEG